MARRPNRRAEGEWSTPGKYLHELISSDERNPTVNAHDSLYGSPEYSTDNMPILAPKSNEVTVFKMPVADPEMPSVAPLARRKF